MTAQLHHDNTIFVKKKFPITLVCNRVNAPANIGSIFRIADSFGIEKIYFCGEDIAVISKRMQRTARATHEIIPYEQEDQIALVIDKLQSDGYKIIGLEITQNSVPVSETHFSTDDKIALIIGDESQGISEEILIKTTKNIHINMYGTNSSMNVATATGIALYEITKQLMINEN
ncbi:TrmH family RNA methyltransferase [uncultured Aquimarina sp.]|uniref:TrmH family RNA methyltransferase n=1 Tax=uncultured Aquimarina sp. TaxID=575652 RepID=UPI002619FD74|nr:TrmH family RNA methyltransferase [uncultured Aquimarina sp.]